MGGFKKLAKAFAVAVRACASMLLTAALALGRFATSIEKLAASK